MLERDKIKNKRMLVKVYGAAVQGIDATIVTIEVNLSLIHISEPTRH